MGIFDQFLEREINRTLAASDQDWEVKLNQQTVTLKIWSIFREQWVWFTKKHLLDPLQRYAKQKQKRSKARAFEYIVLLYCIKGSVTCRRTVKEEIRWKLTQALQLHSTQASNWGRSADSQQEDQIGKATLSSLDKEIQMCITLDFQQRAAKSYVMSACKHLQKLAWSMKAFNDDKKSGQLEGGCNFACKDAEGRGNGQHSEHG